PGEPADARHRKPSAHVDAIDRRDLAGPRDPATYFAKRRLVAGRLGELRPQVHMDADEPQVGLGIDKGENPIGISRVDRPAKLRRILAAAWRTGGSMQILACLNPQPDIEPPARRPGRLSQPPDLLDAI